MVRRTAPQWFCRGKKSRCHSGWLRIDRRQSGGASGSIRLLKHGAAPVSAPLLDGNELRPVLHLHARHEPILAVLGLENRCCAFLTTEPVLTQGIDNVGLVRDEEGVFALFWHLRQPLAKCHGSPAIFVG